MSTLQALLSGGLDETLHALALVIAFAALLAVLLPRPLWPRLRAPVVFALLAVTLRFALPHIGVSSLRTAARSAAVFFLLLAFGRLFSLAVIEWLLVLRLRRNPPKILRDIFEALLVVAASLVTLRTAGMDPTSLLTTSALLTAIIGLSMQDTLGNLFAGLSLQAEQPFDVGDWIQYDPASKHTGRVVEISWRATKIRTQEQVDIVIPNGQLARSAILNYSRPTSLMRRSAHVTVPHEVPTQKVHAIVLEALRDVEGVSPAPPPSVVTQAFLPHGVEHWVRFFITELDQREFIDGRVRDRIWYALSRAGIPLATAVHRVQLSREDADAQASQVAQTREQCLRELRKVELFGDLPEPALQALAAQTRRVMYASGELIVRQGARNDELYLCVRGTCAVRYLAETESAPRELARLGAGGVFGELSLLTGAPRTATVVAIEPCELLVIGKAAVAPLLTTEPALAERLSARLAERQAALEALGAGSSGRPAGSDRTASIEERQGQLLSRIRQFFSL